MLDVHSQVGSIVLTEQERIEGFRQQGSNPQPQEGETHEERQLLPRDAAKAPHAPHDEVVHLVRRGIEVQHRDEGGSEIAYHDADDEQHSILSDAGGEEDDKAQYKPCADECSKDHSQIARRHPRTRVDVDGSPEVQQDDCHAEVGTVADTKDRRTRKRIAEESLKQQSAGSKGSTREEGGERLRHSVLQDDVCPCRVRGLLPKEDSVYFFKGNMHSTIGKVCSEKCQEERNEQGYFCFHGGKSK